MSGAERRFVETYTATFLAAWAAQHYQDYCSAGTPELVIDAAPVEDAEFQAIETWNRMLAVGLKQTEADWE